MPDDLDPQLATLVRSVARRTRLRRAERADVERELASHFREAVAAGRSPEEAITTFGDPKTAARDLRAAAIAKRSPLDRAFGRALRSTGYAIAGVVVLYASFAAYLHLQSPAIKVDTLAMLRDRLAKPATVEDDAWPLYRRAFLALGLAVDDPERMSEGAKAVGEEPYAGMPEWNAAVAWLEAPERQVALGTLRTAAARPVFGFPTARELDAEDTRLFGEDAARQMREVLATRDDPTKFPMYGVLLPQLARVRSAARMLAIDALRAAELGEGDRFVDDIEAMVRMSVHAADGRILIGDLVGMAVRSVAIDRALAALEWKPDLLGEAQLARLQRVFESVPPDLRRLDLGAERLMWVDLEQRLYTDDGRGNGWFRLDRDALLPLFGTVESSSRGRNDILTGSATQAASLAAVTLSGPAAALIVADRRTTHEFFEHWAARIEASSALPLRDHAKVAALDREVHDAVSMDPVRLLLPRLLMPALGRASVTMAVDQARCEAVAAVCAVLRFRADTGSWPTRAEDLVPKYLTSAICTGAPLDPWTGTP
ncbi:MAG: HAAS signaling domain-containing protein, partial [Phycisphaerales bacterium]